MLQEWGVAVDHPTINCGVLKYRPPFEAAFQRYQRLWWLSWRLDKTSIQVKEQERACYRAAEKNGQTMAFLLTEDRDEQAATRFLTTAIRPLLGFTSFEAAQHTLVVVALMPMLKKGPMVGEAGVEGLTAAEQFSTLAIESPDSQTSHNPRGEFGTHPGQFLNLRTSK